MANTKLLECFENPNPGRGYVIEHVAEEFTSVCPKTGHPDFGTVIVRFMPDRLCVELKSLKLYLQSYRNEGIFYEAVTNKIADDLDRAMSPRWMLIETQWSGRGGIRSTIRVEVGQLPEQYGGERYGDDEDEDLDEGYAQRPGDDDDGDDDERDSRLPPGY